MKKNNNLCLCCNKPLKNRVGNEWRKYHRKCYFDNFEFNYTRNGVYDIDRFIKETLLTNTLHIN